MLEEHIVRSNQAVNFSHAKSFRKYSLASALFNKYNAASS